MKNITAKGLILLVLSITPPAYADSFVIGANTKKVRIYDSNYDEIDRISRRTFTSSLPANDASEKRSKIISIDKNEEMLSIHLEGFNMPVWLEASQVKVWPTKMIDCPAPVLSKDKVDQRGVSIGFGEGICK